jgi:hypothetical protein
VPVLGSSQTPAIVSIDFCGHAYILRQARVNSSVRSAGIWAREGEVDMPVVSFRQ